MLERLKDKPFSYQEASEFTGLSPRTLHRLVKRGELAAVKVGRRVLLPDAAVRNLVNGGK